MRPAASATTLANPATHPTPRAAASASWMNFRCSSSSSRRKRVNATIHPMPTMKLAATAAQLAAVRQAVLLIDS
jgi:hypothetical protein